MKENLAEKITIVSNRYHLPRVEAMVRYVSELQEFSSLNIVFQSAEDVLIKYDLGVWKESVDNVYASPEMAELTEKEKKGIQQIRNGKYKY